MSTERKQALRARFGYAPEIHLSDSASFEVFESNFIREPVPVVTIPFPTAKAAKAFCKVANMTDDQRRKHIIDAYCDANSGRGIDIFATILDSLAFPKSP